jgi:hypothetical protein
MITRGGRALTVLSEPKSALKLSQFPLQGRHAVLELRIFGDQRFRNLQIVAAMAAHGSIVANVFGTKRATHYINLERLLVHDIELENQGSGASLFVLDVGANDMRTGRYFGLRQVNPVRFCEAFDPGGQVDDGISDVGELQ